MFCGLVLSAVGQDQRGRSWSHYRWLKRHTHCAGIGSAKRDTAATRVSGSVLGAGDRRICWGISIVSDSARESDSRVRVICQRHRLCRACIRNDHRRKSRLFGDTAKVGISVSFATKPSEIPFRFIRKGAGVPNTGRLASKFDRLCRRCSRSPAQSRELDRRVHRRCFLQ